MLSLEFDQQLKQLPWTKETRAESRKKEREILSRFRKALQEKFNTEGLRKEQVLWELAWEYGHANGLHDVECYYCDMAALIRED